MTDFKLYGSLDLKLGVQTLHDVGTGGISDVATTLPVGTGQGVYYADATVTNFIEILVESEYMHVTGRTGDNLTVVRAQHASTAVAHTAGTGKIQVILDADMPFVNAFAMDPNINTITFEGDGTQEQIPVSESITGSFTLGKWTTDILEKVAGAAAVSSGLPADEVVRYYPQLGTYPYVRGRMILKGQDEADGADTGIRIEIPKMKIQNPWVPGNAGNNAAMSQEMAWSSTKTHYDLLGLDLPGLATGEEVNYSVAVLTN